MNAHPLDEPERPVRIASLSVAAQARLLLVAWPIRPGSARGAPGHEDELCGVDTYAPLRHGEAFDPTDDTVSRRNRRKGKPERAYVLKGNTKVPWVDGGIADLDSGGDDDSLLGDVG
jgi:hypothetical protein